MIIPTFNRATAVSFSVRSVLNQTLTDFEVIVVDDGSTDDTGAVLSAITDPRLKIIRQPNAERGAARNKGVSHSCGKYVFFLDSDDELYPDHLQTAYDELSRLNHPEFFHIRYELKKGDSIIPQEHLDANSVKQKSLKRNRFACQFFLRRDIATAFPFSENRDLKIGEDWEIVLKMAVRFPLHFSNECCAAIHQHPKRTMEVASPDEILRSRDILLDNLSEDKMVSRDENIRRNIWSELTSLAALSASLIRERRKALSLFFQVLKKRPSSFFSRRTFAILKRIIV